ncbi:MAG: DNA-protecting protein DprA [Phycisphaeraceae bacterium]|nr:DNA-protecting protein DprA [Phycisphaeraceae bacterium]
MTGDVSANTKAILLLTAPLLVGRPREPAALITQGEYKRVRLRLAELCKQPADLLGSDAETLAEEMADLIAPPRLHSLLARGFLLAQAIERWHSRAIWVISRADAAYPKRLKDRLKDDAPPVLYGCGDEGLLDRGGLAVVGSRAADQELLEYAAVVGRLAAKAGMNIVSGGAKGIDRAAMSSALEAGGGVVGVLGDSLESAAINRETRESLLHGKLVLVSSFDPLAPFFAGHAMQRNKVVYALADAGLVVNADKGKGGTWTGAVEQLKKYRVVPVFVRATGAASEALRALAGMGAQAWPEPSAPDELRSAVASQPVAASKREGFLFDDSLRTPSLEIPASVAVTASPAEALFSTARALLVGVLETPKSEQEIVAELGTVKSQTSAWLKRLVAEGAITKKGRPAKYAIVRGSTRMPSIPSPSELPRRKGVAK